MKFIKELSEEQLVELIKKYNINKKDILNILRMNDRKVSEQFLIDYGLQSFVYVYQTQNVSEDFIKKYAKNNCWRYISRKNLSEDFIRNNLDKICWRDICRYQKLSEDFIREFKDKIDWRELVDNDELKLSDKFYEEFDNELKQKNTFWGVYWAFGHYRFHRTLGPAIVKDGEDQFWYRGELLRDIHSMEEYKHWLNLRAFV